MRGIFKSYSSRAKFFGLFILLLLIPVLLNKNKLLAHKNTTKPLCAGCNLVIIDLDVLRADAIDCKSAYANTPNICKFAEKSFNFSNNTSMSDLTITSNISFNSSLYPSSHKIWNETSKVNDAFLDKINYLNKILHMNGYRTVVMGHTDRSQNITIGYDKVVEAWNIFHQDFDPLKYLKSEYLSGKPFLFYLYLIDLHFPYLTYDNKVLENSYRTPKGIPQTRKEFDHAFQDYLVKNYYKVFTNLAIKKYPSVFNDHSPDRGVRMHSLFLELAESNEVENYLLDIWPPNYEAYVKYLDGKNSQDVLYVKANYLQILKLIDEKFATVFEYLNRPEIRNNTIVVLRSDHGEEFFEHGSWSHQNDLYQELIRTPLLIRIPGVKPGITKSMTMDIDVLPTLLDALGIQIPQTIQGKSLRVLMTDPEVTVRDYQIAQKGGDNYLAVYRKENWKVTIKMDTPTAIYDLDKDPGEKNNLIGQYLDKAKELYKEYHQIIDPIPIYGDMELQSPYNLNEEKRDRLRNEGYF